MEVFLAIHQSIPQESSGGNEYTHEPFLDYLQAQAMVLGLQI